MRERLADGPLAACNLEMFPVEEAMDLEACRRGLERGALLGARRATQVHIRDEGAATEAFGRLCALAQAFGIGIGVELTGLGAIDPPQAAETFVVRSGVSNASVVLDALHLVRTGGTAAQLGAATRIGYAQICDGPLSTPASGYRQEGIANRLPLGAGQFTLAEIVAALPAGIPISVEVPQHSLCDQGASPAERARRAVEATRATLNRASSPPDTQGLLQRHGAPQ